MHDEVYELGKDFVLEMEKVEFAFYLFVFLRATLSGSKVVGVNRVLIVVHGLSSISLITSILCAKGCCVSCVGVHAACKL